MKGTFLMIVLVCFGMPYGMTKLFRPELVEYDHFRLISGGLGLGLLMMSLMSGMMEGHLMPRKYKFWQRILGVLGGIACIGTLMGSMILIMPIDITTDMTTEEITSRSHRLQIMQNIFYTCLTINLLALLLVWTRVTVKDDMMLVKKGRVFYPGESFSNWFTNSFEIVKLTEEFHAKPGKLVVNFSDGAMEIATTVTLQLDIARTKRNKVETLDTKAFFEQCRQWVEQTIQDLGHTMTYTQFCQGNHQADRTICDLPVSWQGKIMVSSGSV